MRVPMLQYFIVIVLADREISQKEVSLIYEYGKNLGFTEKEISTHFASMIQRGYVPELESIS